MRRTTSLGAELHSKGYITDDDVCSLEPFLFVGLPAAAVVRLVLRSVDEVDGLDFEEVKVQGEWVTVATNRYNKKVKPATTSAMSQL